MTAVNRKRITAAVIAAAITAGIAGFGTYRAVRHIKNEQFFESVTQPISERYQLSYSGGSTFGYASVRSTELLTGKIELFPYSGGDTVTVCFRGDLEPEGSDRTALHRYEGEGIYDYYAELSCTVGRDGSRDYELLLAATSGFDPIYLDISEDGAFSYPVHDDLRITDEQLQTVEKNKEDILQLKADFDSYILKV